MNFPPVKYHPALESGLWCQLVKEVKHFSSPLDSLATLEMSRSISGLQEDRALPSLSWGARYRR